MFNLLTFGIGIISIVALAKINKSNKLFWTLLVSMLIGYAGGSIVGKFGNIDKKKVDTTYVVPMYESPAFPTDRAALLEDNRETYVVSTNSASRKYVSRDMVSTRTGIAYNPENDIGVVDTENTS